MPYFLNPPDSEAIAKIKREVREADSFNFSTKLPLGSKKLKQLENIVKVNYRAWDNAYGKVRDELKSLNRLMEGVEDATEFPFGSEASSQIDLRLPAEKFRSLRANFRRAVFGDHPYGRSIQGTQKTIPGITRDDVVAAHALHVRRGNVVLGAAGDLSEDRKNTPLNSNH